MTSLPPSLAALLLATSLGIPSVHADQPLLILGDSLSKEYEYEQNFIGGSTDAQGIMNWCEILDDKRHAYFDFGPSKTYGDLRLIGHKYNWSVPGAYADDFATKYLTASFPQDEIYGIPELESQLKNDVERVVIFIGGNDIRTNYGTLYDGGSTTSFINDTYADIAAMVDWVRSKKSSLEMVLVGVPHTGCTPKTNADHPYDPVKTGRITTALTTLNNKLQTLANQRGIGYCADVFEITKFLLTADHLNIGNVPIWKNPTTTTGDPHLLFLGDGFHPNEPCQAIFAQRILDVFNAKYSHAFPRLTNSEILTDILGLRTDALFDDWTKSFSLADGQRGMADDPDHDGVKNLMEYALDMTPSKADSNKLPQPEKLTISGQIYGGLTWKPRVQPSPLVSLVPQQSNNLSTWSDVSPGLITSNTNGTFSVRVPLTSGGSPLFLRLQARVNPTD